VHSGARQLYVLGSSRRRPGCDGLARLSSAPVPDPESETGALEQIGIPDDESFLDDEPCLAGWEVPIAGYFINANDTATYEYDFGDDWRHTVTFEGTDELRKGERALACLGGERRCPPEDCGGIYGYTELLDILADARHDEHQSMLEWLGGPYDPEAFSAVAVKFDDPRER
jgi:hypothetical protein